MSMYLRYLRQEEKGKSRRLYEICFPEDTAKFIDYYYEEKCRDNEIIVLENEGKICSMIHANPFVVDCCGQKAAVHYLVAVATDPAYRRQGCMRRLLRKLLLEERDRGEPFSFLMPANPAYYEPFGYRYWKSQRVWELDDGQVEKLQDYVLRRNACTERVDNKELAQISNQILDEKFDLYIPRNASYYERMRKEQQSEGGAVVPVYSENGKMCGSFCYSMEDGFEIREPLWQADVILSGEPEEKLLPKEQIKSVMMGRVLNLSAFVKLLRFSDVYEETVHIRDELLPENNGCYRIYIDSTGGTAEKVEPCENASAMDIAIFGQQMFGKLKIFVNELV